MKSKTLLYSLAAAIILQAVANLGSGAPPAAAEPDTLDQSVPDVPSRMLSVAAARERAKLMHTIYASTLEMMHHRYFHHDRATVPARALEEVFSDIDRQSGIKSSWIAVNARAMSINHEPEGKFELAAVKAIRGGEDQFERFDDGAYRRVGAIRLSGGCMSCHGNFGSTSTTKKFAGLVIEIPLKQAAALPGD